MAFHAIPWHSTPFHGIPWHSMPLHAIPCQSTPFHSIPWHSFHGTLYRRTPCRKTPCEQDAKRTPGGRPEDSRRTPGGCQEDAGGVRREYAGRTPGGRQKRSPEGLLREYLLRPGGGASLDVCERYQSSPRATGASAHELKFIASLQLQLAAQSAQCELP